MSTAPVGGNSTQLLRSFVDRIENLESEIADLNTDKSEVYKEAKGTGFDTGALRRVISDRRKMRKDAARYEEEADLFDTYIVAIGGMNPHAGARAREAIETARRNGEIAPAPVAEEPEDSEDEEPAAVAEAEADDLDDDDLDDDEADEKEPAATAEADDDDDLFGDEDEDPSANDGEKVASAPAATSTAPVSPEWDTGSDGLDIPPAMDRQSQA